MNTLPPEMSPHAANDHHDTSNNNDHNDIDIDDVSSVTSGSDPRVSPSDSNSPTSPTKQQPQRVVAVVASPQKHNHYKQLLKRPEDVDHKPWQHDSPRRRFRAWSTNASSPNSPPHNNNSENDNETEHEATNTGNPTASEMEMELPQHPTTEPTTKLEMVEVLLPETTEPESTAVLKNRKETTSDSQENLSTNELAIQEDLGTFPAENDESIPNEEEYPLFEKEDSTKQQIEMEDYLVDTSYDFNEPDSDQVYHCGLDFDDIVMEDNDLLLVDDAESTAEQDATETEECREYPVQVDASSSQALIATEEEKQESLLVEEQGETEDNLVTEPLSPLPDANCHDKPESIEAACMDIVATFDSTDCEEEEQEEEGEEDEEIDLIHTQSSVVSDHENVDIEPLEEHAVHVKSSSEEEELGDTHVPPLLSMDLTESHDISEGSDLKTPVSVKNLCQKFEKSMPMEIGALTPVTVTTSSTSTPESLSSETHEKEMDASESSLNHLHHLMPRMAFGANDSVSELSGPAADFAGGMEGFYRQQKLQKFVERQKLKETWIKYHCDKEEQVVVSLLSQPSAHAQVYHAAPSASPTDEATLKSLCQVDYQSTDYRGFVFLVHNIHGLLLLQCTRKKTKPLHWQLPGGHVDTDEFLKAALHVRDREAQLMLACQAGAARELFEETGLDVRNRLDRLEPAQLRPQQQEQQQTENTTTMNELKNRLFFFLQVNDDDFLSTHLEDGVAPPLAAPIGSAGSHLRLQISHEHSGFTFEPDPQKAAQMLSLHSGGKCSEALLMAMTKKEPQGAISVEPSSIPSKSSTAAPVFETGESLEAYHYEDKSLDVCPPPTKNKGFLCCFGLGGE